MRQAIANPSARAQLRPWPSDPAICHLTLLDVDMVPTTDDVHGWVSEAFAMASDKAVARFSRIRTGALFPAAAAAFLAHGFVEIDRLVLLERALDQAPGRRPTPPPGTSCRRMRGDDLALAGGVDAQSFEGDWINNAASLGEIAKATPQARQRIVIDGSSSWRSRRSAESDALAFSITGRAGNNGFLQRLAVRPDARRRGVGRYLVDDACRWLTQRGARRAMVNTGVDNVAGLALYERCGFTRCDDQLVVLQLNGPK